MLFTIRLGILAIWGSSFSTISFSRRANENKIKMTWKNLTKEKVIHTIYSTHTHTHTLPGLGPLAPPLEYPMFWRVEPN